MEILNADAHVTDHSTRIRKNCFIVSVNNSGSSFLKNVLSTCQNSINLIAEGHFTRGFVGPRLGNNLRIWANSECLPVVRDESYYDWPATKRAWYARTFSRSESASVFVEKSPTNLARVSMLEKHFAPNFYIFLVRNPYATIEGIRRRRLERPRHRHPREGLRLYAEHVVNCLKIQRENAKRHNGKGVLLTYEDMCDRYREAEYRIKELIPEFFDLSLYQRIPVRRQYNEVLTNMNAEQIDRLTVEDVNEIKTVLAPNEGVLAHYGYQLM